MFAFKHLLVALILFVHFHDISATRAHSKSKDDNFDTHNVVKRQHKRRNQKKEAVKVVAANDYHSPTTRIPAAVALPTEPELGTPPPVSPILTKPVAGSDILNGLYPDIRSCYDGIPRKYQRFAKDRLVKRLKACLAVDANTTSICHRMCILQNLGYITTYTVLLMESERKQRRYKINQQGQCGHNMFGQDLLGIDTKIWDEQRYEKQKKEKELYFEKVNEIGIRSYDPDPFRLKFATEYGEDIVDERLEAQMRICRIFDISTADHDCSEFSSMETLRLTELIECMEKALTC